MTSPSPDQSDYHEVLEQAEWLIDVKRYGDAIAVLSEEMGQRPPDPVILSLLSQAFLGANHLQQATGAAKEACRLAPMDGYPYRLLASAQLAGGHLRDALQSAKQAVANSPTEGPNHLVLARVLMRAKRFGAAEASVKQAAELDPASASPYVTLSAIQFGRAESGIRWKPGTLKRARSYATRALELEPENAEALNLLGYSERSRLHLIKATSTHLAVLRADPHDVTALRHIGYLISSLVFAGVMGTFIFSVMNLWFGLGTACVFVAVLALIIRKLPRGGTRMALTAFLGVTRRRR